MGTNDEDEGDRAKDANRARTTGAALEAHYRFVLWLVPTVERFPRKQKFFSANASRRLLSMCWSV